MSDPDPVPFTDAELAAARLRAAVRTAAEAFEALARAWKLASTNIRRARLDEIEAQRRRLDEAELYLIRLSRGADRA